MDITRTSGKRVSAGQRGAFCTAGNTQAFVGKLWKAIAACRVRSAFECPGMGAGRVSLRTRIDVPGATATAANGNSTHEIAGQFDDADGNTHGFVLNKGVFTFPVDVDLPGAAFYYHQWNQRTRPARGKLLYSGDPEPTHAFLLKNGDVTHARPGRVDPIARRLPQRARPGRRNLQEGRGRPTTRKTSWLHLAQGHLHPTIQRAGRSPSVLARWPLGINDIGQVVGNYVVDVVNFFGNQKKKKKKK